MFIFDAEPVRKRGWLTNGALAALGVAFGIAAGEGTVRLLYRGPWYERLVAAQAPAATTAPVRNALGLRGPNHGDPKDSSVTRILLLGDSFTFGVGVPEDSLIFAARLARDLRASGRRVEVLNGGLPGGLTSDWVALLDRVKDTFRPDLILMVFFLRDGTRTGAMHTFFAPIRREIVERNQRSWLYRHLYLYRWYRDAKDRPAVASRYARALIDAYTGSPEEQEEWRIAQANLRRIQATGEQLGAAVGLAIFPVLVDLQDPYPFQSILNEVASYASAIGLPTHQLLPAFLGEDATRLWVSPLDQHPNARGHEIAARSLTPFVRMLLDSPN